MSKESGVSSSFPTAGNPVSGESGGIRCQFIFSDGNPAEMKRGREMKLGRASFPRKDELTPDSSPDSSAGLLRIPRKDELTPDSYPEKMN